MSAPTRTPTLDSSPGRPRDPVTEKKALAAALDVFGRRGWSGFNIGVVAKEAQVGKSSIYLRWGSREALLLAAFEEFDAFFEHTCPTCTTFREMMCSIVAARTRTYFEPAGLAVLRLHVEYQSDPEQFGDLWKATLGRAVLASRDRLREARRRGELQAGTSITQLGNALEGAMLMHVLATPHELRSHALEKLPEMAEQLVARTLDPWLTALATSPRWGDEPAPVLDVARQL